MYQEQINFCLISRYFAEIRNISLFHSTDIDISSAGPYEHMPSIIKLKPSKICPPLSNAGPASTIFSTPTAQKWAWAAYRLWVISLIDHINHYLVNEKVMR